MSAARSIYHRLVPTAIRNPLGMLRRRLADLMTRVTTVTPLPPVELLANIQMTPFVSEYLAVGRQSASSIVQELAAAGIATTQPLRVLDFGCGSARALRHILTATSWKLDGCDVDRNAVEWAARTFASASFKTNAPEPPLPYDDSSFDAVYAISLFTHFSPGAQKGWISELQRVVRPGGIILISTMGPSVIANFPAYSTATNIERLRDEGVIFIPSDGAFNASASFHTLRGVIELGGPSLQLLKWSEQGLDGFQDLALFRRVASP